MCVTERVGVFWWEGRAGLWILLCFCVHARETGGSTVTAAASDEWA